MRTEEKVCDGTMLEKMPLVSVVVPVYNAEKYLPECLESIINQTYKNLEILLVNDGSKDQSLNICREYAQRDSRIKVYDRTNHGSSASRNFGLEQATGEYLCFVDSDDYCELNMIESLTTPLRNDKNCNISICGIRMISESDGKTEDLTSAGGKYTVREYLEKVLIQWKIHLYVGAPYARAFRVSMLRENPIRFDESISFAEDFMFNMLALNFARLVNIIDVPLYNYRRGVQDSLSNYNSSKMPPEEFWREHIAVYETFEQLFKQYGLYEKYEEDINSELYRFVIGTEIYIIRNASISRDEKMRILTGMRDNPKVDECLLHYHYADRLINRIRFRLICKRRYDVLFFIDSYIARKVGRCKK